MSQVFKVRDQATDFLNQQGVPTGKAALANMARSGEGPKFVIVNGRALYREKDLLAWIEQQAARPLSQATARGRCNRKTRRAAHGRTAGAR